MKVALRILMIVAGLIANLSAKPLEYWDFNEQSRADLELVENSGIIGSIWNWATTGSMETDGEGHLVIKGDGGKLTRKLPKAGSAGALADRDIYASPLAGDSTYSLKLNLSGWDLTETTANDLFIFKATDTDGSMLASISIKKMKNEKLQIQMGSANSNYRKRPYPLKNGPVSVEIRFNFSTKTVEYYIDGVSIEQFNNLNSNSIGSLILLTSGAWNKTKDWIKIDSMGLNTYDASTAPPVAQLKVENIQTQTILKKSIPAPLAHFEVQKGDIVLVLISVNKNSEYRGESISFKGTASVENFVFEKSINKGPSTYAWHATANSTGSVEVNLSKPENILCTVGTYHLRSSSGAIEQIGSACGSGKLETTLAYTFPAPASGMYFEACSTYNADGAITKNPGTTVDLANKDGRRVVAHGTFTQKDSIENTWTSQPGSRPTTLLGIAFGCVKNQ